MKTSVCLAGAALLALSCSSFAASYDQAPAAAPAPAQAGWYAGVNGGVALIGGDESSWINTGFNAGGQVGYRYNQVRVEAAYNYTNQKVKYTSVKLESSLFMANALYDINLGDSNVVPYIGGGLGMIHQFTNVAGIKADNEFAYQGIAGLDYKINDNVRAGVNYHLIGFKNSGGNYQNLINAEVKYFFNV
jgi:opacity protein-like surface antigen